jgi:truncated hemoglobin YjbI
MKYANLEMMTAIGDLLRGAARAVEKGIDAERAMAWAELLQEVARHLEHADHQRMAAARFERIVASLRIAMGQGGRS